MQMQREDDKRSILVRTVFFNQQANNKIHRDQEVELRQIKSEAEEHLQLLPISHRQRFEREFRRLRKICQQIKNEVQEEEANFPILDKKSWKSKFNTLNELTSATDRFLEQVEQRGCYYKDDKDKLNLLSDDLEVTSNLLESPTEQNMVAFQQKVNDTKISTLTSVAYTMFAVGIVVTLAATSVLAFSVCIAPFFLAMPTFTTMFNASCITAMGGLLFSLVTGSIASHTTGNRPINTYGRAVGNTVHQCMSPIDHQISRTSRP